MKKISLNDALDEMDRARRLIRERGRLLTTFNRLQMYNETLYLISRCDMSVENAVERCVSEYEQRNPTRTRGCL